MIRGVLLNLATGSPPQKRRSWLLAERLPTVLSKCALANLLDRRGR